jgi:hypothetical protein
VAHRLHHLGTASWHAFWRLTDRMCDSLGTLVPKFPREIVPPSSALLFSLASGFFVLEPTREQVPLSDCYRLSIATAGYAPLQTPH